MVASTTSEHRTLLATGPPALPDMVEVAVDNADGAVDSGTGAVMTDTAEESVARWRQILGMEDGGVVRSGEALSDTQQDIIRDQYQALPPAERLLFCMGLNAFLSTVLMDATMCIRDVELSHLQDGSSDEETRREEPDETAMMQRQWVAREGRTGANPQDDFSMMLQTFASALERLPSGRRAASARMMRRWLAQSCGRALAERAEALDALLVVHGDGHQSESDEGDQGWLQMWWNLLQPKLEMAGSDPAASSSTAGSRQRGPVAAKPQAVVDLDTAARRAAAVAAKAKADAQAKQMRDLMQDWAATSERLYLQGEQRKKDADRREVEDFNRRVQAMAYRDWEEWVVLNTGPSGGYTSPGGPGAGGGGRKRTTQVEALVQQGGVSIGKRARWQLEINESRPLLVQFEIGIRGNGTQVVNAKSHGPVAPMEGRPDTTNETAAPSRADWSGGAVELSGSGREAGGASEDGGNGRGGSAGLVWLVTVDLAVALKGKGDVLMTV